MLRKFGAIFLGCRAEICYGGDEDVYSWSAPEIRYRTS